MRSIIFKLANLLRKMGLNLSQALKAAWSLVTKKPAVEVVFKKENNEIRTAKAVISSIALNKESGLYARFSEETESGVQFRSFNFSRLISISI